MVKREAQENRLFVTEIERCAVNDGPGIRTVVFLQGCPLHCVWCCNPETQPRTPVLMHRKELCVGCGICAAGCSENCISFKEGKAFADRDRCCFCKKCIDICPVGAFYASSKPMTVPEILSEVLKDKAFYEATGGGLTLSGGEPLLNETAAELLKKARNAGLHTCVETTAFLNEERLTGAAPYVDLFYIDYKHPDAEHLKKWTGADLSVIENNIRVLVKGGSRVVLRSPVIPSFNHDNETLERCFRFASETGISEYILLPYHSLGKKKYERLDSTYPMGDAETLKPEDMEVYVETGRKYGLSVSVG